MIIKKKKMFQMETSRSVPVLSITVEKVANVASS